MPEILAPAGSAEALYAAIACGADAVYLGIDVLNARRGAENFTAENLRQTVANAHIKGVKVYLTLNIVVLENEISQLMDTVKLACEAGVDAVIVQDLGAAALIKKCAPALRMHASTQMAVHNPEGARVLEELGFSRVVLARELSKEEIAAVVRFTSMEVEVFVHGALCMCVSGQCYLSSVLGQRSGNRGLCAQPCRLSFQSAATDYALSLKDMSLIARARELQEIGVASLKIEGRMKRPEYVAAAVTACRDALEGRPVDLESLQSVFSRSGFTDGYFSGRRDLTMFGVRHKQDVLAAAGVLGKLENLYNEPKKHIQKVGVEFSFSMQAGKAASLEVTDQDGNSVSVDGQTPEIAVNKPTDEARVKAALEKTGGTPYRVESIRIQVGEGLMMPVSLINAMRRDALDRLDEIRAKPKTIQFTDRRELPLGVLHAQRPALRVRCARSSQLSRYLLEQAEMVILPVPEMEKLCKAEPLVSRENLCVGLPRMLFSGQEQLISRLKILKEQGISHASVGNLGALAIGKRLGFHLHGECFFNVVNSYGADALARLGLTDLELSFELGLTAAKRLRSPIPYGVAVYGHLPLMTVRNCPVKAAVGCQRCQGGENKLTDRKGNDFLVNCAWGCSEILNPVPLFMGDRMEELSGLDFGVLRFTQETALECEKIVKLYQEGGKAQGAFTRGLLYKTIY